MQSKYPNLAQPVASHPGQIYPQQQYTQQQALNPYQQPMILQNGTIPAYNPYGVAVVNGPMMVDPSNPLLPAQPGIMGPKTGFQKLDELAGVYIKQKIEYIEAITGCETENKYNVYALAQNNDKKGRQLFKCKEKSGFCARQCLSGGCRPFQMSVTTLMRNPEDDEYAPFLSLERPCTCTCLCFNRPEVRVTSVEGGRSEYLGKVVDPFNWCGNMEMDIYDKDNALRYVIYGSCCQLGMFCRCPCDPCQTLEFDIRGPSGEVISKLEKRTAGCLKSVYTDVDNFALKFPENITGTDKALLMAAVLFLDFRHFEINSSQNNNGYMGGGLQ